jgi:hypothetical protein
MTHTPGPWETFWYVCKYDAEDVAHAKEKDGETHHVGEEMWRIPIRIGPCRIEHNHWAGNHLAIEDADAALIAASPDLLEALQWFVDRRATITAKFQLYGPQDLAEAMVVAFIAARAAITKATQP